MLRKAIGVTLVATPFVVVTMMLVAIGGIWFPVVIWGSTVAAMLLIGTGLYLIDPSP